MPSSSLTQLYRAFLLETEWILSSFQVSLVSINTEDDPNNTAYLSIEMTIIRLHDAWARFNRELIIMSAAKQPITAGGRIIPRADRINTCSDVLPKYFSTFTTPNNTEPKWAHPAETIAAARKIGVANYSTIAAALGAVGSPIEELRLARNFFAHKCWDTVRKIRGSGVYPRNQDCKVESIAAVVVPGATTRMEYWIIWLRIVAEACIQ